MLPGTEMAEYGADNTGLSSGALSTARVLFVTTAFWRRTALLQMVSSYLGVQADKQERRWTAKLLRVSRF